MHRAAAPRYTVLWLQAWRQVGWSRSAGNRRLVRRNAGKISGTQYAVLRLQPWGAHNERMQVDSGLPAW